MKSAKRGEVRTLEANSSQRESEGKSVRFTVNVMDLIRQQISGAVAYEE
jgi:hypothetical protein